MSTLILAVVVMALVAWLINKAGLWWWYADAEKFCSQPANHVRRMAALQEQIDECQQQLDYYLQNPNWFDLQWPVCGSLVVSSNGEYCVNCFRQVHEHLVGVGVA